MSDVKILKPDITGLNPDNLISGEVYAINDYTLPYLRPDYTPFYKEGVVVTDKNGQILKEDVDYTFVNLIPPLMKVTGKEIYCYIKIINDNVFGRGPLTLDYQSFGINQVLRAFQNTDELVDSNKQPVGWDTGIRGRPNTFPVKNHLHDITNEIVGWDTFIEALNQVIAFRQYRSLAMYNELKTISDNFWNDVEWRIDQMGGIVWNHTRNYNNPHGLTKYDVNLGNVDNHKTGSTSEQLGGTPQTLVTAQGSKQILENVSKSNDNLLKAGTLPFSFFGNNTYLNPNITGDVSGIGFGNDGVLILTESNGDIVALLSRYNGVKRGLFYYRVHEDGLTPVAQSYTNDLINANNDVVTNIMQGSNGDFAIMSNEKGTNAYLVATNQTLDVGSHITAKIDLTKIVTSLNTLNGGMSNDLYRWEDYYTLVDGGSKLFLFAMLRDPNDSFSLKQALVYSLDKSTIYNNATVSFSSVNLTFTPLNGVSTTPSDGRITFVNKGITNNKVSSYFGKFNPALDSAINNQTAKLLSGKINQSDTTIKLQFITEVSLVLNGVAKVTYLGATYTLDEIANTLIADDPYNTEVINFNTDTGKLISPNFDLYEVFLKDREGIGFSVVDSGDVYVVSSKKGQASVIKGWGTTPYSVAAIIPSPKLVTSPTITGLNIKQNFTNFDYHAPNSATFDLDGVYSQVLVDGKTETWFNYNQGPFISRPDFKNENVAATFGFTTIGLGYKVTNLTYLPRITFIREKSSTGSLGETQWNPLTFVSSPTVVYNPDDVTDQFMNNRMVKTHGSNGVSLDGDGSFTYWSSGMIVDIINWLTNSNKPKSIALELFFVGDTGLVDSNGSVITMPVFANALYSGDDNVVYNVYGICKAHVVTEKGLTADRSTYRVTGLELAKSIYVDGHFGVNNGTLSLVSSDGSVKSLLIGKVKDTGVKPSEVIMTVRYFTFPLQLTKSDGSSYNLEVNPRNYDTSILAGVSSRKLITANPTLNNSGLVNFKKDSTANGASVMTVMLSSDETKLSFYLRSAMNIRDTLTNRTLFTYARHVMNIADGTRKGIESEAYRQTFDDTIDSLNEIGAIPGVGEVNLGSTKSRTGMTGIFGVKGNSGYWVSTMVYPNNWTLYFNEDISVNMSGTSYTLAPTAVDLTAKFANYTNSTFNIYVVIRRGKAEYLLTQSNFPVNNHLLFIGTVSTNATGISKLNILKTFMVNDHIISVTPRGNAIPAVGGLPTQTKNINWY